jgi:hypothetical protein
MYLYTNQPTDFDIVKQKSDVYKSSLYTSSDLEHFKSAYDYLFSLLGSNQWIWCRGNAWVDPVFTPKKTKVGNETKVVRDWDYKSERLWVLDVPENKIVCIDSDIWNYAISDWSYDKELWDYISNLNLSEEDSENLIFDIKSLITEKIGNKNTYKKLIKKDNWDIYKDEFLIPSPVKKSWVEVTYTIVPDKK